ncbi:MAG: zinc metallopeptidase [Dysgonamonadaceae bacterium]|jgi:Zn-dependent membrane protease YugP|nr:zinc metallopeptidase [Dysgonamonadaceae bacterium]
MTTTAWYWILFIGIALVSWLVQANLNRKFKKYSQMPLDNGMTGKDVAEKMLRDNGLDDVQVVATRGSLTDNYNPTNQTINLSEDVYYKSSVAAAAVAAHETGHALQHAQAYAPLKMRSALVPAVSFSSKWVTWILLGGMILMGRGSHLGSSILLAGIGLFALTTLFSFITLPVEINASQRALAWLSRSGITNSYNDTAAKDALKAAAYTYVVAALGSLATLLYYVMIFLGGRRN